MARTYEEQAPSAPLGYRGKGTESLPCPLLLAGQNQFWLTGIGCLPACALRLLRARMLSTSTASEKAMAE